MQQKEIQQKVSLKGRTAREVVRLANKLPWFGSRRRNGEIQNLLSDHEVPWHCPEGYIQTIFGQEHFTMELLSKWENQEATPDRHVILQLHGGGYYARMHNTYRDSAVAYIECSGGYDVLTPDYRVAPENPYPAALEDALFSYQWLLRTGYQPKRILLAGDSAGGGLALALALYLRDHELPMPGGIVTMSAWTDLTKSGLSYEKNYEADPVFGGSLDTLIYKEGYYAHYDPSNPYISPLFGDFTGFPPMLMQVGEVEMMLDDTLRLAEKAKAAGVYVRVHEYSGMFHIFQMAFHLFRESADAWSEIGRFLHKLKKIEKHV